MLTLEQATRFYETLAKLIGRKEGVEIKVTVTPRPKGEDDRKKKSYRRNDTH